MGIFYSKYVWRVQADRHETFNEFRPFINALQRVPHLAEACSKAIEYRASFSGVKTLRAVSRGARAVVHTVIKRYVMELGEECPPGLGDIVKFLRTVTLVELSIRIPDAPVERPEGETQYGNSYYSTHAVD